LSVFALLLLVGSNAGNSPRSNSNSFALMVVVRRIGGLEEENVVWKEIAAVAIFFSLDLKKSDCPSSCGEELAALLERRTYSHWRYPVDRRKKMTTSGCSCCTDVFFSGAGSRNYEQVMDGKARRELWTSSCERSHGY
jgi:hypothetical protein